MVDRIVVNVVDGREEVAFRAHEPLGGPVKNLTTTRAFLAVPRMTGASVKASQFMEQLEDVLGFDQRMVMVRQYAPSDRSVGVLLKQVQQGGGETVHALR